MASDPVDSSARPDVNVPRKIVMLCSLDTKGREAQYLRECIEQHAVQTILVDIGYGLPAKITADISVGELAADAGSDIAALRGMEDTAAAAKLVQQGAILRVRQLIQRGECHGVVGFGGLSNTTLVAGVMKTLPVGLPKLIISSSAAMPAYAAKFYGARDITIMNAIVDISGLNDLTRTLLRQGAGAICGMAACYDSEPGAVKTNKMIAVTSFRFAETCCQYVISGLEQLGYTVVPFHAQGVGEDALEELVSDGLFDGVVDVVPAGLSEQMLGGNRAARSDRLEAAGRVGVPHVIAPSGFDMISCGPIGRRDGNDPLWQKLDIHQRQISIPDDYRVEARTSAGEVSTIARTVADKLNRAKGSVCVLVPQKGWSSLSTEGAALYNPEADAEFAPTLRKRLVADIPVIELPCELNSEKFALALVDRMHAMILSVKSKSTKQRDSK